MCCVRLNWGQITAAVLNNWKSTDQRTQTSCWQSSKRGTRKLKERVYLILMTISFPFKARLACLLSSYWVVFIILRADVSKYRPEVYKTEKSKILKKIHKVALGKLTGRPPSVSGGRCWLKSERRSFFIYRRNTKEQYGGYNLFQNAEFKANVSIKVWRKC